MTDKLKDVSLFLLDMDGTLYLGERPLDGAREFIRTLDELGLRRIYLTNNSSRSCADTAEKLKRLGFPCGEDDVFSSSIASAMYIKERYPEKTVYPVGTQAFISELEGEGVPLSFDGADIVLVSFDTELTYEKLNKACDMLRGGAVFLACNPDLVCPMDGDKVLPDCGSICALLTASTGKDPFYIGKPQRIMIDMIAKKTGFQEDQIACVGDRLYTDVAAAQNAGAVSICVLSGETDEHSARAMVPPPDYIFPSVKELGKALKGECADERS